MEQANNATGFMLPNHPARFRRTRQHSASFSSPPSPQPKCRPRSRLLHFHRFVFAYALAAPSGEGVVAAPPRPRTLKCSARFVCVIRPGASRVGTDHASLLPFVCYCLGMASVLSSYACRRSHSASLRITSSVCASVHPCPGNVDNGERKIDGGGYRNPSPRPPPAIIRGRGSRSHAKRRFCQLVATQPLLLSSRFPCLSRYCLCESGRNAAGEDSCPIHRRHSPRRLRPRLGSRLLAACQLLLPGESSHRTRCVGPGSCRVGFRSLSPTSPPTHPRKSRYVRVVRCAATARFAARPTG